MFNLGFNESTLFTVGIVMIIIGSVILFLLPSASSLVRGLGFFIFVGGWLCLGGASSMYLRGT
jgi:hypothetical protein